MDQGTPDAEPPQEPIEVRVPPPDFVGSPNAHAVYQVMGNIIEAARAEIGDEMAYSVILSRVTRELRRSVGTEGAKKTLQGYVDTMDQAQKGDR